MKKAVSILCVILLLTCALAGCGAANDNGANDNAVNDSPENPTSEKTLVVYYSATGSTKAVAETIAETTSGDLFEIVPEEIYSDEDLNWSDNESRASREHDDETLREVPLVETAAENWEDYDTVYIGFPIWWGIAAWLVNSFIKANDFTGKTVIPFCTSASSDLGESGRLLAEMAGTGDWQDGQRFSSGASKETVTSWVKSLELDR